MTTHDRDPLLPNSDSIPLHSMPPLSGHNERFLRICGRHEISQRTLSQKSGLAEGHVSRVLSGQYPVTVDLIRAAWSMTHDAELVAMCLDDHVMTVRIDPQMRQLPREHLLNVAMRTAADCAGMCARALNGANDPNLSPALLAMASTMGGIAYTESSRPTPIPSNPEAA